MQKSELLERLKEKQHDFESLLEEIGAERMERPGVNGDWSMKDMLAHLTGWNRRLVASLRAAARGESEPPTPWPSDLQEDDEVNGWIYETYRNRSLREILDETHQTLEQLIATVQSLPDDVRVEVVEPEFLLVWVNGQRYPTTEFFDHFHDDHEPDVRAWLKR